MASFRNLIHRGASNRRPWCCRSANLMCLNLKLLNHAWLVSPVHRPTESPLSTILKYSDRRNLLDLPLFGGFNSNEKLFPALASHVCMLQIYPKGSDWAQQFILWDPSDKAGMVTAGSWFLAKKEGSGFKVTWDQFGVCESLSRDKACSPFLLCPVSWEI